MASGEVENDNAVILPNPRSGHADPANFLPAHLGRLYRPGDGKTFDGVVGKDLSSPIPEWAE